LGKKLVTMTRKLLVMDLRLNKKIIKKNLRKKMRSVDLSVKERPHFHTAKPYNCLFLSEHIHRSGILSQEWLYVLISVCNKDTQVAISCQHQIFGTDVNLKSPKPLRSIWVKRESVEINSRDTLKPENLSSCHVSCNRVVSEPFVSQVSKISGSRKLEWKPKIYIFVYFFIYLLTY